jgi:hypothetical protein
MLLRIEIIFPDARGRHCGGDQVFIGRPHVAADKIRMHQIHARRRTNLFGLGQEIRRLL